MTTDHISPAGSIPRWSPAGEWLQAHGVAPLDFNSYGARRGHHEVMMRGTFGNIRLRNALAAKEGPYTTYQPDGDGDVPVRRIDALPGRGRARWSSSRAPSTAAAAPGTGRPRAPACWACAPSSPRATSASIAPTSWAWASCRSSSCPATAPRRWGSTGRESFDITGSGRRPGSPPGARWSWPRSAAGERSFRVICRLDGPIELDYYRQGGILPAVLRRLAASA